MFNYLRKWYGKLLVSLRRFKNHITLTLIKRTYKGPINRDVTRNAGEITEATQPSDLLGKFKHKVFTHLSLDMTGSGSKAHLTRKEKAMLFLANKLATPKKRQREIRAYRDKETKKVTIVNRVKEVK